MRTIYCIVFFILLTIAGCGKDRPAGKIQDADKKSVKPEILSQESSWPMFMHDISYLGTSTDAALRPPLSLVWKFKTGGPVDSSPVVADGTVYVGSNDHSLYALDARKWGLKWEFKAEERIITAPTVYEGAVYFSARNNKVYALDAATGAKKWEYQADGWINSPVVAFHQKIYLGCYDRKIYVLDAATGRKKSQERLSVKIGKFDYISSQGEFYPMDARQRANTWRTVLPYSESWPATIRNVVYIGARDNKLHALDSTTRREIWYFETDGWVDSSPAVVDGMLYVGSRDGYIYAFGNASESVSQTADDGASKEGIVTHDKAQVYSRLDDMANAVVQLNAGRSLRITDEKPNWYQVILPDDSTGWMSESVFTAVRWSEDLRVNNSLVKDVKRLIIPKKAEKPSWSPDGSKVVFFDNMSMQGIYRKARSIWLASFDGSNPTWVTDGAFFNLRTSWSGNSEWFTLENLAQTERQVWMVRSNGTGLRKVTEGEAPAISPGGVSVAFIRRNKIATSIWVYKLDTGKQEKLVEIPVRGQESHAVYSYIVDPDLPAWSPDDSYLAVGMDGHHYSDNNSRIAVISASGGVIREIADKRYRMVARWLSPGLCISKTLGKGSQQTD